MKIKFIKTLFLAKKFPSPNINDPILNPPPPKRKKIQKFNNAGKWKSTQIPHLKISKTKTCAYRKDHVESWILHSKNSTRRENKEGEATQKRAIFEKIRGIFLIKIDTWASCHRAGCHAQGNKAPNKNCPPGSQPALCVY